MGAATRGRRHPWASPPVGAATRGRRHPWAPPPVGAATRHTEEFRVAVPVGTSAQCAATIAEYFRFYVGAAFTAVGPFGGTYISEVR